VTGDLNPVARLEDVLGRDGLTVDERRIRLTQIDKDELALGVPADLSLPAGDVGVRDDDLGRGGVPSDDDPVRRDRKALALNGALDSDEGQDG